MQRFTFCLVLISFFLLLLISCKKDKNQIVNNSTIPTTPIRSNLLTNLVAESSTAVISTNAPLLSNYVDQSALVQFTANTTTGSNIITVSSTANLAVGKPVIEQGFVNVAPHTIPLNTTITGISGTKVTLSNPALSTQTSIHVYAWTSQIELIGGFPFRYNNVFTAGSSAVYSSNLSVNNNAYVLEFMTDAANFSTTTPSIIFSLYPNGGTPSYRLAIDDVYQTDSSVPYGTTNALYLSVTFQKSGTHKVRLELAGLALLYHTYLLNNAKLWRPDTSVNNYVAMFSDSYFASGAAFAPDNMGFDIATLLGWTPDILSVGGTGYVNNGGTNFNWASPERIADLTHRVYKYIIIQGSVNDAGQPDAKIAANALTLYKGARAAQPTATIFIFGCAATKNLSAIKANAIEADLKDAFKQWNSRNAYFIPITGDPEGAWINDSNVDQYIAKDGTHPSSPAGQLYLARKYSSAITNIFKKH